MTSRVPEIWPVFNKYWMEKYMYLPGSCYVLRLTMSVTLVSLLFTFISIILFVSSVELSGIIPSVTYKKVKRPMAKTFSKLAKTDLRFELKCIVFVFTILANQYF